MRVAFVSGLSDKKLKQKLDPLIALADIQQIDLYRRKPYLDQKVKWIYLPAVFQNLAVPGDLWRMMMLLVCGYRYDVIIGCHQKYHGIIAWLAGKIWNKPVIQMIISDVLRIRKSALFWTAVSQANACAVRGPVSENLIRDSGYSGPVSVIANPYVFPARPEMSSDKTYDFICVAGLVPLKGHAWLLEQLAVLKQDYSAVRLAIVGSGHLLPQLKRQVSRLGLESNVDFLGWLGEADLIEIYQRSKVLVLCSWHEGLPMCVVEAMSMSMPVIATTVGELPLVVDHGENGFLVDYHDSTGLLNSMSALLADHQLHTEMGQKAVIKIRKMASEWTVDHIKYQWSGLLQACHDSNNSH